MVVPEDTSYQGVGVTDVKGILVVGIKSDPLTQPDLAVALNTGPLLPYICTVQGRASSVVIIVGCSQSNLSTNPNASKLSMKYEIVGAGETGREMFAAGGEVEDEGVANVRKAEKGDCQNTELWTLGKGMQATLDMKVVDVYGKIYTDGEFGALSLAKDRMSVLYITEKNVALMFQGEIGVTAKVR